MQHPKNIAITDYQYHLPNEKIAQFPLNKRDESKLLVYKNENITEDTYQHISQHLPENALMVFNNTKVVEARLLFTKNTGSTIEIFCLEPHHSYANIAIAMMQTGKVLWKCLIGGAKKWKEPFLEKNLIVGNEIILLQASKIEQQGDSYIIEFSWGNTNLSFAEILHYAGILPLPPYMNRQADEKDAERYQTIYAKFDGSVAAPTAGLHFTENVLQQLQAKNIKPGYITLHVGAGTFKPVKADTMEHHEMHSEYIDVPIEAIRNMANASPQKVIAVGTTSLRTIETLYWMGVKAMQNPVISVEGISIKQWDAYELNADDITPKVALENLIIWMKQNKTNRLITKTQIIIAPPYTLKVADALVTNFHQPQSTLLLLVAAVIGNTWRTVYDYALNNQFRFLSYGDGSLLWKQ
jgi:S-adenosylmethionine:tRNA ribosyltransferase-isomerase